MTQTKGEKGGKKYHLEGGKKYHVEGGKKYHLEGGKKYHLTQAKERKKIDRDVFLVYYLSIRYKKVLAEKSRLTINIADPIVLKGANPNSSHFPKDNRKFFLMLLVAFYRRLNSVIKISIISFKKDNFLTLLICLKLFYIIKIFYERPK